MTPDDQRGLATASAAPSWSALLEPPHATPAIAVILCTVAPAFGFFITATVLPSVVTDIGGLALYAWASTAYAVGSILGSAGSSVVVHRTGLRGTLLTAALILVAGTAACALAPGMPVLVGGRALQGLGGGVMTAAVHGVVRELFPEFLWPRVLAMISGAWGIAAMSGPAIGGLFAGHGLWRWAFWAMVPLVAVAAAMTWHTLPRANDRADEPARAPLGRLGLMCLGVLCLGSVANTAATAARAALLAAAATSFALMLRLDRASSARLFPADLLSLRGIVGKGTWMIFFIAMSTTPGSVYLPLLLQRLHGIAPAAAGYFYAGQSLAWTSAALISARLSGNAARAALVLGPLMTAAGFAGLWRSIADGPVAAIAASALLVGAGIGTCWAHVASIVLGSARHGEGAVTAALIPTTQTFAVSMGAALSGIIANAAGLSGSASRPAAALAGAWLFRAFLLSPLTAAAIASRLPGTADGARRRQPHA